MIISRTGRREPREALMDITLRVLDVPGSAR